MGDPIPKRNVMAKTSEIVRVSTVNGKKSLPTKNRILPRPPETERRILGLGQPMDAAKIRSGAGAREGMAGYLEMIATEVQAPVWNMQTIEQVRWDLLGPVTDETITANFSESIDLFGSGKDVPGIDKVETTMAQAGQTQTYMITCFVGVHLNTDPLCFTVQGNAWSHPTTSSAQPPSPDVFTLNDLNNGALGAAFVGVESSPSQLLIPAVYEHGWWAQYAAWMMVLGYNLRWKIGQHTNIMDDELRNTAYMISAAQPDSASISQVDVVDFIARLNERYDSLGSALDFLKINRLRIGSVLGLASTNVGIFKPDRSLEVVDACFGGMGVRTALLGNREYRKLAVPYIIKAGVPIGLFFQETDAAQANIMRRYLSITQQSGSASIPPLITDDGNISSDLPDGTGVTPVALERTLDGFNVPQQMLSERALFKGGEFKIALKVMGFEVTECWYDTLKSNPDLAALVQNNCGGCCIASQGA
jgi:hypothetical protein